MKTTHRSFTLGIALASFLAVAALLLARVPGLGHLGALSIALLLGLAWRAIIGVPEEYQAGIGFSAKKLLRLGIILLGVRLNLELIAQAGARILLLDVVVVIAGLLGISWLGRRLGLDPVLACLIAVGSSICGGSAVAAAAPVLRANDEDVALAIPLCSVVGTVVMLLYTLGQHHWALAPENYGLIIGATLHEVAQVIAAVGPFPESAEIATVTKLTRVVLLVPVVFVLGQVFARRRANRAERQTPAVPKPWFVLGFLLVGIFNTLALRYAPEWKMEIITLNHRMLDAAGFLMAIAMASMGLQVDFARLRTHGLRAMGTAVTGWVLLAALAAGGVWLMSA